MVRTRPTKDTRGTIAAARTRSAAGAGTDAAASGREDSRQGGAESADGRRNCVISAASGRLRTPPDASPCAPARAPPLGQLALGRLTPARAAGASAAGRRAAADELARAASTDTEAALLSTQLRTS